MKPMEEAKTSDTVFGSHESAGEEQDMAQERSRIDKDITGVETRIEQVIGRSHDDVPPEINTAKHDLDGMKHTTATLNKQQLGDTKQKLSQVNQAVAGEEGKQLQQDMVGMMLPLAALMTIKECGKLLNQSHFQKSGDFNEDLLFTGVILHGIPDEQKPPKRHEESLTI